MILVALGATRDFNPNLAQSIIDKAMDRLLRCPISSSYPALGPLFRPSQRLAPFHYPQPFLSSLAV